VREQKLRVNYTSVFYVPIFSVIGEKDYKTTKAMSAWDEEPTIGDDKGVRYFNYLKQMRKTGIFFSLTLF